ncbi:MAG TPA: dipeptidase [Thermoanaerobaculia bacterium]|nr:dipeptidase [Thermoanaerobaculia bacterium]
MTTISPVDRGTVDVPAIHRRAIIVDGHCDTPYRLKRARLGIADRDHAAQVDLDTLQSSGITASFFAAYVPPYYAGRGAHAYANALIDVIEKAAAAHPDQLLLGRTSDDIRRAKQRAMVALMIGVEGGHAIEDSLETLSALYGRGARYMTLTHVNTNNWADSSGDGPRHGGLTRFGREVVAAMNDLGMIVDISHVADTTYYHVLETSRVTPIASHSSSRALANHPRNMSDAMLRDLATVGGVCMVNFFSAFIDPDAARIVVASKDLGKPPMPGPNEELPDDTRSWDDYCRWFATLRCPRGTIDTIVDHIAHIAAVAGVETVGIGSDFDGVPLLPSGVEDAAALPRLTGRMLERGFHENEVEKILGGNFMRVFEQVEAAARR